MKSRLVRILISLLSTSLTVLPSAVLAKDGPSGSGGGYAFKKSSDLLLTYAISNASLLLGYLREHEQCANELLIKNGLKPIDFKEMIDLIKNTKRLYTVERTRKNVNGEWEPLAFDYGVDQNHHKFVAALKTFFVGYMTYSSSEPHKLAIHHKVTVRNFLIHEAAHHFKYTEDEADRLENFMDDNFLESPGQYSTDVRMSSELNQSCIHDRGTIDD